MSEIQEAVLMCLHCGQPIKTATPKVLESDPAGAMIDFWDNQGNRLRMLASFAPEPKMESSTTRKSAKK